MPPRIGAARFPSAAFFSFDFQISDHRTAITSKSALISHKKLRLYLVRELVCFVKDYKIDLTLQAPFPGDFDITGIVDGGRSGGASVSRSDSRPALPCL